MQYRLWFLILGIAFFSLAACITSIENRNAQPTPIHPTEEMTNDRSSASPLVQLPTPTVPAQSDSISYTVALRSDPKVRIPITISGWSVYTSTLGFSLKYPTDWQVSEEKQGEQLYHLTIIPTSNPATQEPVSFLCVILLHPQVVNGQPSNAIPNEGAETYWPTPLNIPNANALLYAWGAGNFDGRRGSGKWTRGGVLRASYYSTGLDLELLIDGGHFDDLSVEMAQQMGFVETVAQRFPVFYHIVRSVRFANPISTLIPHPAPTNLIQTGTVTYPISSRLDQTARIPIVISGWSTYTSTLGFSLAYPTDWNISEEKQHNQLYYLIVMPNDSLMAQQIIRYHATIIMHPQVVDGQPSNAIPNEGATIYWPASLNIPDANALFYAKGAGNFDSSRGRAKWRRGGELQASYYSPGLDLELLLIGGQFDDLSVEMAQQVGFVETVEERFPVFYHIAQSVRFAK